MLFLWFSRRCGLVRPTYHDKLSCQHRDFSFTSTVSLSLCADSRGRRVDAKGNKPSTHTGTVRPASADTLDFDDDDDEDTEDVFERVRRKYNLQIDSDDDDISRL